MASCTRLNVQALFRLCNGHDLRVRRKRMNNSANSFLFGVLVGATTWERSRSSSRRSSPRSSRTCRSPRRASARSHSCAFPCALGLCSPIGVAPTYWPDSTMYSYEYLFASDRRTGGSGGCRRCRSRCSFGCSTRYASSSFAARRSRRSPRARSTTERARDFALLVALTRAYYSILYGIRV